MTSDHRESRGRGRPRQFDREEAVEKAMMAFWSGGYGATGMTELIDEMGLARQSLYNTFGAKHDLFLTALEHYGVTRMAGLVSPLDDPDADLDAIRTVLTWWATSGTLAGRTGCLLVNTLAEFGSRDPEVAQRARGQIEETRQRLRTGLERAAESRRFGEPHALDRVSVLLVGTAVGLNLLGKVGFPAEALEQAIGVLMDLMAEPG